MAKKSVKTKVKEVAKSGAQGVSSVAGEALGAAAVTAAGVVVERMAQALGSDAKKVEEAKPSIVRAAKKFPARRKRKAKKSRKAPRKKTSKKRSQRRKK